jgi:hypothetical protein
MYIYKINNDLFTVVLLIYIHVYLLLYMRVILLGALCEECISPGHKVCHNDLLRFKKKNNIICLF